MGPRSTSLARAAVEEHEELGEKARNLFGVVVFFELAALFLRKKERLRRGVLVASVVTGIVAAYFVIEAAEHGGEVVYTHAGGVGTRSGNPEDVRRLLVAGLYHQTRAARAAGHSEEAARLTEELVRQVPGDTGVALLAVESMLDDRQDPQAALAALDHVVAPEGDRRFPLRKGLLASRALAASGQTEAARATLVELASSRPRSALG